MKMIQLLLYFILFIESTIIPVQAAGIQAADKDLCPYNFTLFKKYILNYNSAPATPPQKGGVIDQTRYDAYSCNDAVEKAQKHIWGVTDKNQNIKWNYYGKLCLNILKNSGSTRIFDFAYVADEINKSSIIDVQKEVYDKSCRNYKEADTNTNKAMSQFLLSYFDLIVYNTLDKSKLSQEDIDTTRKSLESSIKKIEEYRQSCDDAQTIPHAELAIAYLKFYHARLTGKPTEKIRLTDIAPQCVTDRLKQSGLLAELEAPLRAAQEPPAQARAAADLVRRTGGKTEVAMFDDPVEELTSLAREARKLDGARDRAALKAVLQRATTLIAQNRVAIAAHEAGGATRLGADVNSLLDHAVAESLRSRNVGDRRILAAVDEKRRFETTRFFGGDCDFKADVNLTDHRYWGRGEKNVWIIVIFRSGDHIHALRYASDGNSGFRLVKPSHRSFSEMDNLLTIWRGAIRDWQNLFTSKTSKPNSDPPILGGPPVPALEIMQRLLQLTPAEAKAAAGLERLVIIPDSWAARLPFAALPLAPGGGPLINTTALAVMPAYDSSLWPDPDLPQFGKAAANADLLIGVLDDIPMEKEAKSISSEYFQSKVSSGRDFSFDRFRMVAGGSRADVLHLSTHAQFLQSVGGQFSMNPSPADVDKGNDQRSSADLGRLITAIRSNRGGRPLELVTLSACETGVGGDDGAAAVGVNGDGQALGMLGLALRSGARASLGSLWQVHTDATSLLMEKFYAGLKEGLPKDVALRKAQLDLSKDPKYASPYYWAGFELSGDWSPLKPLGDSPAAAKR